MKNKFLKWWNREWSAWEEFDGYRLKHKVSINKIQRDILKGKILNQDLINEKYGDYINFMLIEQAIILKYNHINKISF